ACAARELVADAPPAGVHLFPRSVDRLVALVLVGRRDVDDDLEPGAIELTPLVHFFIRANGSLDSTVRTTRPVVGRALAGLPVPGGVPSIAIVKGTAFTGL